MTDPQSLPKTREVVRTVSHRIRAALAVLAVVAAVRVVRHQRRLEQELTAERAGHRLVESVVQTDHEEQLARLRAAVAAAPAAPSSSATRSHSQEGGLS